jgi:hypothetical protein
VDLRNQSGFLSAMETKHHNTAHVAEFNDVPCSNILTKGSRNIGAKGGP